MPPSAAPKDFARFTSVGWTIAAIMLISFNLRPSVTGLGAILGEIDRALGFSPAVAGLLTTVPVLCFGLISPFTPGIARRVGIERTTAICLALMTIGTAIRGLGGVPLLFLGMIVVGFSIGVVNVLLPAVVKQDFPNRVGAITGLYTGALCIGAAASALLTAPFERAVGGTWRSGLAIWAVPVAIALIAWLPQLQRRRASGAQRVRLRHGLWGNALAWQVTLYLTALTALAYFVFAWGATLLRERGLSGDGSSEQMALSFIVQAASGFLVPLWAARRRDQRFYAVLCACLVMAGLSGWVFAPISAVTLFSVLSGLGQGGAFGLALALIGLRAANAETAGPLSGMAQTVAYIGGGLFGPFAVGLVHQWTGGWSAVGALIVVIATIAIAAGFGAGRALTVDVNRGGPPIVSHPEQKRN